MRKRAGYPLRDLAARCNPPMDYSTVGRIERNMGYTGDSLERIAKVLDCEVYDFFLPDELTGFTELPADMRSNVADHLSLIHI